MHADVERYYWGGKNDAGKKLTPVRHTVGASHGANGKTRGDLTPICAMETLQKHTKWKQNLDTQTIG
jgi:hypothetical protein